MIKRIVTNSYLALEGSVKFPRFFAVAYVLGTAVFALLLYNFEMFSSMKMWFLVFSALAIFNFFFCQEHDIDIGKEEVQPFYLVLYVLVLFGGFYVFNAAEAYLLGINSYFIVKLFKNTRYRFSVSCLAKAGVLLLVNLMTLANSGLYSLGGVLFGVFFAACVLRAQQYKSFYEMTHYVSFNFVLFLPLFFSFRENKALVIDFWQVLLMLVLFLGGTLLAIFSIWMILSFPRKYVLLICFETSMILLSLLSGSVILVLAAGLWFLAHVYIVDFSYEDGFRDPENENLVSNEAFELRAARLKDKLLCREVPEEPKPSTQGIELKDVLLERPDHLD